LDQDQIDTDSSSPLAARLGSGLRRIFTTPHNIFGLSRRYEANELPSFDPEQRIALRDLSDIPVCSDSSELKTFYPYPNRSAFELGHWHWNGGAQKSQASFRELVDIIGNPEFQSTDIRNVNWDQINKVLGTDQDTGEWLEEDAGWTKTPVTISVPYQSRRGIPSDPGAGPRNYTVDDFHHRSLVSIIREKVSGLSENHQFHFDPYELHWQRDSTVDPIRVQGELYTSPMFIDAHRELQDAPGEPGCDLPRVVVALMFWSDATQLTAFGNAKLWPLYLFFGNDSKYSRCRPTCHLCEHVAYFQMVSCLSQR
jgi:Plavaka transposase